MPTRTNLLASGTTPGNSSTFTVDAGAPATLHLNGTNACKVQLQRFDGTNYYPVMEVYGPGIVVAGQGTYRVYRDNSPVAFQVDVEK